MQFFEFIIRIYVLGHSCVIEPYKCEILLNLRYSLVKVATTVENWYYDDGLDIMVKRLLKEKLVCGIVASMGETSPIWVTSGKFLGVVPFHMEVEGPTHSIKIGNKIETKK